MASIFTRIIHGEIPGRIIWADDACIAMLDIRPLNRGHVLVIPRAEVDHWVDLPADVAAHLMTVSHHVGSAQREVVSAGRVGLMIAGFEVPHTHVHVLGLDTMGDMSFANAAATVDHGELAGFADRIREALRVAGHADAAVDSP